MRCIRLDANSIVGSAIEQKAWSASANSSSVGLCWFPIEEIRMHTDDIRELSVKLSRDLGHALKVALIADIEPDKRSIGHYAFADDIVRECSIYSWDHAKIIAEIPCYKGLTWNEVMAL